MQADLPARPDLAPAPTPAPKPRRRIGAIIASVVGGLIVLGALSSLVDSEEKAGPSPTAADTMTRQEAMTAAAPLMTRSSQELTAASTALDQFDIAGAIPHIQTAADLTDQAAALFIGVDVEMEGYLSSAADHYRASSDALAAQDFDTATAEMNAASDDIDAATAAI